MKMFLLLATTALLASCAPSAAPTTWNYYDTDPGGIRVDGPATYEDLLLEQTPEEACTSLGTEAFPTGFCEGLGQGSAPSGNTAAACESDSAFELLPPGWSTPGNPWIRRCP